MLHFVCDFDEKRHTSISAKTMVKVTSAGSLDTLINEMKPVRGARINNNAPDMQMNTQSAFARHWTEVIGRRGGAPLTLRLATFSCHRAPSAKAAPIWDSRPGPLRALLTTLPLTSPGGHSLVRTILFQMGHSIDSARFLAQSRLSLNK